MNTTTAFQWVLIATAIILIACLTMYAFAPKHPVQYQLNSTLNGTLQICVDIENGTDQYIILPQTTTLDQAIDAVDKLNAQLQKYPIQK
jgi:hypothetical protein